MMSPSQASQRCVSKRLQAEVEPPWADNCSMDVEAWKKLGDCMGTLALRNAALETLLEVGALHPDASHVRA